MSISTKTECTKGTNNAIDISVDEKEVSHGKTYDLLSKEREYQFCTNIYTVERREMMIKFAVFMRGVNVNGINIKMDELKAVISSIGYEKVKTVQASGNIIISTSESVLAMDAHKNKIQQAIGNHFNYEAFVFLKTQKQLSSIVHDADSNIVPDGFNHYVLLSDDWEMQNELIGLFKECKAEEQENLIARDEGTYWIVKKGMTLKTEFGKKVLGRKKYKDRITSRTIGTIKKVYGLLEKG